ncbi:MAG: Asp-tRNA(Asn)/Glu-tRNA(Gln) amidotransferase subunit GatC [Candidatus Brocadiia bacterium]
MHSSEVEKPVGNPVPDIRHIARLARLELTAEEEKSLAAQLDAILAAFRGIADADVSALDDETLANESSCPLRPDEIKPSVPRDEILRSAPCAEGGVFKVPRVIP